MRIANDSRYVVRRLGFHPIFRIEGAADRLDPEDWIPACESGILLASLFPHGSADTHNPDLEHLTIPYGLEKMFTIT